jgi:23S rRNA pseudouridine2605 synthase
MSSERLNKVIAAAGVASRRAADQLIQEGRVTINEKVVRTLGTQVLPGDVIAVDGKPLRKPALITYLLYKPKGVICSSVHQGDDNLVTDLVPAHPRVYSVGRLDKESEGLILLTNDGDLAQRLTHPKYEHVKEYVVSGVLDQPQSTNQIITKMTRGVKLGDGIAKADKIRVQPGKGATIQLTITVHEGRHHLIRRMCAAIGISVKNLVRTQIAHLTVGSLRPGDWRILSSQELANLA